MEWETKKMRAETVAESARLKQHERENRMRGSPASFSNHENIGVFLSKCVVGFFGYFIVCDDQIKII